MRKIQMLLILTFLSALTINVTADDTPLPADVDGGANMTQAATPLDDPLDPTLEFFSALASCTPGTYTEKNILTSEVGQANLTQQIIGYSEDKLTCNAVLTTPDNRTLTCAFPTYMLPQLNDQHFLEGVLEANSESPGKNSLNADLLWSKAKADSCSLSGS